MNSRRLLGLGIIAILAGAGILAPLIAPHDPIRTGTVFLGRPSYENWLGTDDLGRDIFSRILYGTQTSLVIGFGAAIVATLVGVPIGLVGGYLRGKTDLVGKYIVIWKKGGDGNWRLHRDIWNFDA